MSGDIVLKIIGGAISALTATNVLAQTANRSTNATVDAAARALKTARISALNQSRAREIGAGCKNALQRLIEQSQRELDETNNGDGAKQTRPKTAADGAASLAAFLSAQSLKRRTAKRKSPPVRAVIIVRETVKIRL